jgi:hypothetical protein
MPHSDSAKVTAWRERLARFQKTTLTVPQFCASEGVSRSVFYVWRKKLADKDTANGKQECDDQATSGLSTGKGLFATVVVSQNTPPVTVRLPGDVHLELPSDNLAALRAVVAEVLLAQSLTTEGSVPC